MIQFLMRRLLLLLITLGCLSLVSFTLSYYSPLSELDSANIWRAYQQYLQQILQGNFGVSSINAQSILKQLKQVFPATLELCSISFLLALLLGIPLGIAAAAFKGKWPDISISTFALLGFSIPAFWLALLLLLVFALELSWLPVSGRYYLLYELQFVTGFGLIDIWLSDTPYKKELFISLLHHMILPIVTLTLMPLTEVIRLMRASAVEVYETNYIKAATLRNLSRFAVIRRHLFHNAFPPLIPKLGIQFSSLLSMAILVETVFSLPGMGRWLVTAIRQQDYAAISAGVLAIGALVIIVNVVADIFGALMTPQKNKD